MKLIDILIRELPKRGGWPDGVESIAQCHDGDVWYDNKCIGKLFAIAENARPLGDTHKRGVNDITREQYEDALAASKQEWNGDGLPPVGCECEVKVGGDYFNLCRVVYSDKSCGVAFVYLGGDDEKYCGQIDCVSAKASSDYFRPIRSEADKKRDDAIQIIAEICRGAASNGHAGELVYEAISTGKITGVKLED